MARKGSNIKRCERYKASGHKEINKRKCKEKSEKRIAEFVKKKENNPYSYDKKHTEEKLEEAKHLRTSENQRFVTIHTGQTYDFLMGKWISGKRTEYGRMKSAMKRLDNEIKLKEEEFKKRKKFRAYSKRDEATGERINNK